MTDHARQPSNSEPHNSYRDVDCPNCGRHRVWADGVCDKCFWDIDGGNYASITRPEEYDANGRIVHLPENNPFERTR